MPTNLTDTAFLLNTMMANITDNIYFKNLNSQLVLVNDAFCDWIGLSRDEVIGHTDFDIFTEEHARMAYEDEQKIIQTGEPIVNKEECETWSEGRVTWVSTTKMPIRNDEGKIIGTFGMSRDITRSKEMEQELREARDEAERAAQAKSIFLANMSHEIRTPLNAVVGMAEMLADTPINPLQQEYLDIVDTSSEALMNIVNDILDLSKIESGKLELEAAPFNLIRVVQKSVDILAPKAARKGLELMQHFIGTVPEQLIGDAARLRQVLLNLLSNAVKFTPQGEILVEVSGTPNSSGEYKINFLISDTGIGLSPEEAERILKPFEQADTSITRQFGGTGLGLSICNKLIAMMGGEMTVQSEKGIGSTFKFFILARQTNGSAAPEIQRDTKSMQGRRVLLVDDNSTNLKIMQHDVELVGMIPFMYSSGTEALNALPSISPIDIAVIDYAMPGMDGLSLAKSLRAHENFGDAPILIASSSGLPPDGRPLAASLWMSKPIKKQILHEAMADLLGGTPKPPVATGDNELAPALMSANHPYRILLVEDNRVNQMVALKMLEKMGYSADLAINGQKAVEAALEIHYDIILMDIQMPVMDGLEATQQIRQKLPVDQQPRIIGLSAHALPESRNEAIRIGMDDYLTKPLKMKTLVHALASSDRK
jgi:PAS domain S-box-containing protein